MSRVVEHEKDPDMLKSLPDSESAIPALGAAGPIDPNAPSLSNDASSLVETDQADIHRAAQAQERWQHRLLPFMITALCLMGLLFFALSYTHYQMVSERLKFEESQQVVDMFKSQLAANVSPEFEVRAALELATISRRYAHLNTALLTSVWTRQMGFLAGMVLVLCGSVFVLGKLRETINISGVGQGIKATLVTSSPGLVLAVLGSVLIATSTIIQADLKTYDVPTYIVGAPKAGAPEKQTGLSDTAAKALRDFPTSDKKDK